MSGMPSCVPPNQTQARSPSGRGMMLAAWFCTQGDGRYASNLDGSDAAGRTAAASGVPSRSAGDAVSNVVLMKGSFLKFQGAIAAGFGQLTARSIAITTIGVRAATYMLSIPYGSPRTYQTEVNTIAASRPSVAPRPLRNSGR